MYTFLCPNVPGGAQDRIVLTHSFCVFLCIAVQLQGYTLHNAEIGQVGRATYYLLISESIF